MHFLLKVVIESMDYARVYEEVFIGEPLLRDIYVTTEENYTIVLTPSTVRGQRAEPDLGKRS